MKNKVMKKILMVMLSATMLIGSASVTAFAQANENAEQTEATEQVIEEQPAEQPATEGTPFSTPGNGQLVDDKENDSTKQFLTVQTKNGNTFYMVIDRSGTSENVYMMSLVDENDLAEFLDETKETENKQAGESGNAQEDRHEFREVEGNGADYNARRDAFDLQYPLYWSAAWNAPLEPDDL